MKNWIISLAFATVLCLASAATADARPRGNSYPIIATGAQRQAIKSTDIRYRPNRLGHFYGNTVRRRYHRGAMMVVYGR